MLTEDGKKALAIILSQMDCSIQRIAPVTSDTDGAYESMINSVPKEHRQAVATAYIALQNAFFVKLAHNVRTVFNVDPNDELLGVDSVEAFRLAGGWMEEEMTKRDAMQSCPSEDSEDALMEKKADE